MLCGEITHHDNVVVAYAAHIEGSARTLAESVALVEGLRLLVPSIGAEHNSGMPQVSRIGDSTLDERICNTAATPRLVNIALGQVGTTFLHAPGTHHVARQRIGSNVGEHVTDEATPDLGDEQAMMLGIGNKIVKHVGTELRGDVLRNRFLGQVLRASIRERTRRELADCDDVLKLSLSG